jgi:hypothetical protein
MLNVVEFEIECLKAEVYRWRVLALCAAGVCLFMAVVLLTQGNG